MAKIERLEITEWMREHPEVKFEMIWNCLNQLIDAHNEREDLGKRAVKPFEESLIRYLRHRSLGLNRGKGQITIDVDVLEQFIRDNFIPRKDKR